MAVILVSLVIWAGLLTVWSPPELWPDVASAEMPAKVAGWAWGVFGLFRWVCQLAGDDEEHPETNPVAGAKFNERDPCCWASGSRECVMVVPGYDCWQCHGCSRKHHRPVTGLPACSTYDLSPEGGGRLPFRRKGRRSDGIGH